MKKNNWDIKPLKQIRICWISFPLQEKKALEVLKTVDTKIREIKAPTGEEHNPAMSCHDVKQNHPDSVKKRECS